MGVGKKQMSEGTLDRLRIKDWSPSKQGKYYGGLLKEMNQEAALKKKNWSYDSDGQRKKCVDNTMKKLQKEGLVKEVPGFFKHGLKLKGI